MGGTGDLSRGAESTLQYVGGRADIFTEYMCMQGVGSCLRQSSFVQDFCCYISAVLGVNPDAQNIPVRLLGAREICSPSKRGAGTQVLPLSLPVPWCRKLWRSEMFTSGGCCFLCVLTATVPSEGLSRPELRVTYYPHNPFPFANSSGLCG